MSAYSALAPYVVGTLAGLLVLSVLRRQAARGALTLPPGPKPLPLLGNLLDIPQEKQWLTYHTWMERYGDVVYIEALGQKIVILGSAAAVTDLLERRSAVYSDRPGSCMLNNLMGLGWALSALPYGEIWRRGRRLMHTHVHQGVADRYHSVQIRSARLLAQEVLVAKTDMATLTPVVRFSFGRLIVKMVYGIDVKNSKSEYISLPEKVNANISEGAIPGRFLVDMIPALRHVPAWFPGANFQRYAQQARIDNRIMRDKPIEAVQAQMAGGTALPSIARAMLEDDALLPPAESQLDIIKDVTGIAYLAGSDTTAAAIISFFLAMLVYPDVQAKAQAEVDRVVGKNRLPEHEDAEHMPYVQCVVNECLRWLPVLPLATPHATSRDDEYKGYLIPKGTIVMGSVWSILHNAQDYPEPEVFKPERYLASDGTIDPSVRDPRIACFGYGRRVCPGRHIAEGSLFAMVATLLASVDIVRARNAQGVEIVPEIDVTSGLLMHTKPFAWSVRPRSEHSTELLASALAH